ncbi:MAG: toll/interleukin-1 receptor domain-containing protein [Deltaproteobacteria bacterium]|nr:toll/interleukin-1 receptor domain-containing protein [Deltaproteobacteria bacterium]
MPDNNDNSEEVETSSVDRSGSGAGAGDVIADVGTPPRIFLSYSHHDLATIKEVERSLQNAGGHVWYADESLRAGQNFSEEIAHEIQSAAVVALCVSPNSVRSRWVRREVEFAVNVDVPIVPVMLTEVRIPSALDLLLGNSERIRWEVLDATAEQFVADLRKQIRKVATSDSSVGLAQGVPRVGGPPDSLLERWWTRLVGAFGRRWWLFGSTMLILYLVYLVTFIVVLRHDDGAAALWFKANPAVHITHMLLLPVALSVVLYLHRLPSVVRMLRASVPLVRVPITMLVLLVVWTFNVVGFVDDLHAGTNERIWVPIEIGNDELRAEMLARHRRYVRCMDELRDGRPADDCGGGPWSGTREAASHFKSEYRSRIQEGIGRSKVSIVRDGNAIAWFAPILSLTAGLCGAYVFVFVYGVVFGVIRCRFSRDPRHRSHEPERATIGWAFFALVIFSLWFPLRHASDAYINFDPIAVVENPSIIMFFVMAVAGAVLLALLGTSERRVRAVIVGLAGTGMVCLGLVVQWRPEWAYAIGEIVAGLSLRWTLMIYTLIVMCFLALSLLYLASEHPKR